MDVQLFCRTVAIGAAIAAFCGVGIQSLTITIAALALGGFALLVDRIVTLVIGERGDDR